MLECAYHACHAEAEAEISESGLDLAHLRFYTQNIDGQDPENAKLILECRFVSAQLLATDGRSEEALAELKEIKPAFQARYGADSVHVRNLERQIDRLRSA